MDNILIAYSTNNKYYIIEFKSKLQAIYKLRNLKETIYFLEIQIVYNKSTWKLWLFQDSYIEKLKEKYYVTKTKQSLVLLPDKILVSNISITTL